MDIVYITLFFSGCLLLSLVERQWKIPFAKWIFIIPFCVLIANRSVEVPDTEAYLTYYGLENTSLDDYGQIENCGFELGFRVYTKLIKLLVGDEAVWYFAFIALTNLLIIDYSMNRISRLFREEYKNNNLFGKDVGGANVLKESFFSIMPLTLYVSFFGLYFNAIVLRSGIALSLLVFASSIAIKEGKKWRDYLLLIALLCVAYLFHATAVIGGLIIFVVLVTDQLPPKNYLLAWFSIGFLYFTNLFSWFGNMAFSAVASLNTLPFLALKLSYYEGEVVFDIGRVAMKFMFFWAMALVLIIHNRSSKIYYKYLNVYLAGLALWAVFRSVLLIERITDYFLLFSVVLFYLFLSQQKPLKFLVYYILIIVMQLIFVLRITNRDLL